MLLRSAVDSGIFSLAVLLSTGSRTITESYRAAPFQGWSVHPSTPCAARQKKPQPRHRTSGGQERHPHCAGIATLPGQESAPESAPESAANQTRIAARIGDGIDKGKGQQIGGGSRIGSLGVLAGIGTTKPAAKGKILRP